MDAKNTNVIIFLRPQRPQAYSMERVVELFTQELPPDIDWKVVVLPYAAFTPLSILKNGLFARRHHADVFHISGESHYLTFFLPRRRTILTIHDSLILSQLKGVKRFILRWFFFVLPVHWVGNVTTISEASKNALKKWTLHSLKHTEIVYDPLTYQKQDVEAAFSAKKYNPVFMTIGTKFNKNIERCIQAVAGMPCKLLMIGRLTHLQIEFLIRNQVEYENRYDLTEEELKQAYRDADALLFPSLGEGFGMPILEAQAFGRPVITSNCSSMPEVAGQGALLVDPSNISEIKNAIQTFIDAPEVVEDLISKGIENLKKFTAGRIAERYASLYRKVRITNER